MTRFADSVHAHWAEPPADSVVMQTAALTLATDTSLPENRPAWMLTQGDHAIAVLRPELLAALDLPQGAAAAEIDGGALRILLAAAGSPLHEPDRLLYPALAAREALLAEGDAPGIRRLTEDDAELFEAFTAANSEEDLDAAYVELDHWRVVGAVDEGVLLCAASAYPFGDSAFADVGVLTSPDARGRGLGRAVVRALARTVIDEGYEPQYRSQLDNPASLALGASAGFAALGDWEVVDASE